MASKQWQAFERRVAKAFEKAFGFEVRRAPISGGWAKGGRRDGTRDSYGTLGDIVAPKDKPFPFFVECKFRKNWKTKDIFMTAGPLRAWWGKTYEQARRSGKHTILVVGLPRTPTKLVFTAPLGKPVSTCILLRQGPLVITVHLWDNFVKEVLGDPAFIEMLKDRETEKMKTAFEWSQFHVQAEPFK
jgi:Holliday junction resolvase